MITKSLTALLVTILFIANASFMAVPASAENGQPAIGTAGLSSQEAQAVAEKGVLIANINALRNQETRVTVLQQFLSEEQNKLFQMQAVFCDRYHLDLDKFRAGRYSYNADTGQFLERR